MWDVLSIAFYCYEIDTTTKATVIKESVYLGQAYNFRDLVHHHHAEEQGSAQADGAGELAESSTSQLAGGGGLGGREGRRETDWA